MAFNYCDNSTSYAFSGTMYENPSHGTARLNYIPSIRSTAKLGFTTDTSASEYCKLQYIVNNKTAYIGRYSDYTTSSSYTTTSNADVVTGGITYSVSNSQTTSYLGSYVTISDENPQLTGSLYSSLTESTTVYKGSHSNTSTNSVTTSGDVYSVSNEAYTAYAGSDVFTDTKDYTPESPWYSKSTEELTASVYAGSNVFTQNNTWSPIPPWYSVSQEQLTRSIYGGYTLLSSSTTWELVEPWYSKSEKTNSYYSDSDVITQNSDYTPTPPWYSASTEQLTRSDYAGSEVTTSDVSYEIVSPWYSKSEIFNTFHAGVDYIESDVSWQYIPSPYYSLSQNSDIALYDPNLYHGTFRNISNSYQMLAEFDNWNVRHPDATFYDWDYSKINESSESYSLVVDYPGTNMAESTSVTSEYESYNANAQTTGYISVSGKRISFVPAYGDFKYTSNFTRVNNGSYSMSYTSSWNGFTGYFTNNSRKIIGNPWYAIGGYNGLKYIVMFSTNNNSTIKYANDSKSCDTSGVRFIMTDSEKLFLPQSKMDSLTSVKDYMKSFTLSGNGPIAVAFISGYSISGKSTTFSYNYAEGYGPNEFLIDAALYANIVTNNYENQSMAVYKGFSGTERTYSYSFLSSKSTWHISASSSTGRYDISRSSSSESSYTQISRSKSSSRYDISASSSIESSYTQISRSSSSSSTYTQISRSSSTGAYSYSKSSRSTSTQASLSSRSSYTNATVWRESSTTTNNFNI